MENQYFIFKIKSEYLPEYLKNNKEIKIASYSIYCIDLKYFRKLKLQNIEGTISEDNKKLIEYLINDNFVHLLTQEEYKKRTTVSPGVSGSVGYSGVSGVYKPNMGTL